MGLEFVEDGRGFDLKRKTDGQKDEIGGQLATGPAGEHLLVRLLVGLLSWRIRAQSSGSLPVPVPFGSIFLAVTGLAVDLRLVRCHRGAVQPLSAAHCAGGKTCLRPLIVPQRSSGG